MTVAPNQNSHHNKKQGQSQSNGVLLTVGTLRLSPSFELSFREQANHDLPPAGDMISATSRLQLEAAEVRAPQNRPNWSSYLRSNLLPQEHYNFVVAWEEARSKAERDEVLARDRHGAARALIGLVVDLNKEQLIRYVLTLFDDLLQEDKSRVEIFHEYAAKTHRHLWHYFQNVFTRNEGFIINQMSSIYAKLICFGTGAESSPKHFLLLGGRPEFHHYISFLLDELKKFNNEYVSTSARCLQMLLRHEPYRHEFVQGRVDGLATLASVLNGKCSFQLQYQLVFCLWSLSYSPPLAARIQHAGLIQTLGDILAECAKEKVIRIILATFRNVLEKLEELDDKVAHRGALLQMMQCRTLKTLERFDVKHFAEDPDLVEDLEWLVKKLVRAFNELTSWDEYLAEVHSGRLHWSPVHKSEKFWAENTLRFNENHFEIVKILIKLLETSQDALVLCVAAHDLGEYVRHYPRGKKILDQYEGKRVMMALLEASDPNVRYHALLAVQKLMVHMSGVPEQTLPHPPALKPKNGSTVNGE